MDQNATPSDLAKVLLEAARGLVKLAEVLAEVLSAPPQRPH